MADSTVSVPEKVDETLETASGRRGTYLELLHSWIVTVDHKRIGILYIVYGLMFLAIAGVEALADPNPIDSAAQPFRHAADL